MSDLPLCACGCGEQVRIGQKTGEPNVYVHTHHTRKSWEDYPEPVRDPQTGCLRWQGSHSSHGYGLMNHEYAHRVAYERVHGPIPPELEIDHVYAQGCRFKDCVNVDHLEPVTGDENRRRWSESFTHCPYGHEYTVSNGRKRCLVCHRERERAAARWRKK